MNYIVDSSFDEQIYLLANPDVKVAVNEGIFSSGYEHYQQTGKQEGRISNINDFILKQANTIFELKNTLNERDNLIREVNNHISETVNEIEIIKKSLSWKLTQPIRKSIGSESALRKVITRSVKVVKWTARAELPQRYKEWKNLKAQRSLGTPHLISLSDDFHFVVPFNYKIEKPSADLSIAVIFHCYYPELVIEAQSYLSNIPYKFDLFITTDTEEKKSTILNSFSNWNKGKIEVRIAPNHGRDIAPKLLTCRDVYDQYEFFLHIHSKKSPHHSKFATWRNYLFETLIGSEKIVESIFSAFIQNPKLGMIAPDHFESIRLSIGWGWNLKQAIKFARRFGINVSAENKIDFPSGSMFWGRSEAIKPLLTKSLTLQTFEAEDSQLDGTVSHIIERLYFFVCEKAGYQWIKIATLNLQKDTNRSIFVNDRNSLAELIHYAQYNLIDNKSAETHALSKTKNIRQIHSKSELRLIDFSEFVQEFEKHLVGQASKIDFDEQVYLSINPDIADAVNRGDISCGYEHYCLSGQYEKRRYSDNQVIRAFNIKPNYPFGFFAPMEYHFPNVKENLTHLPDGNESLILVLFSHLQNNLFYAGYREFFKDYVQVFERFDRIVIAVNSEKFETELAQQYMERIEVIHLSTIGLLKQKPSLIISFNAHLTLKAHELLPDHPDRIIYYCQEFESGLFPYGYDYIIGEKAVAITNNLVVSTALLKNFLVKKGLIKNHKIYLTSPQINIFNVLSNKTKKIFLYYRPELFNKRNIPEILMEAVYEFCKKMTDYEIHMIGSVDTTYSFKINGNQVYIISKLPKDEYTELISSCDVVVSMIYAAHPGVIAFQAAASGIPTITNTFENRDADLLKSISKNIIPYDPVRENLCDAIFSALKMPKGEKSFNKLIYTGQQEETFVDFHENILKQS